MKRELAIKYASEVARRLHQVNGIIATPNCVCPAVVVRRVWVFGSTVKGADNPNDLDLLIDMRHVGRGQAWCPGRKLDKRMARTLGWSVMPDSVHQALVWLTRGMRHVSRHRTQSERAPIDVRVLIYPRWDLPDPPTAPAARRSRSRGSAGRAGGNAGSGTRPATSPAELAAEDA